VDPSGRALMEYDRAGSAAGAGLTVEAPGR